jgi:hypothetical protein
VSFTKTFVNYFKRVNLLFLITTMVISVY